MTNDSQQTSGAAVSSSELVSPLPCPFCGVEAKIVPAAHGPRIHCRHDSTCMLRSQIVYDFQLPEWNRRPNAEVSDGGPLTHESKQSENPPFAAPSC